MATTIDEIITNMTGKNDYRLFGFPQTWAGLGDFPGAVIAGSYSNATSYPDWWQGYSDTSPSFKTIPWKWGAPWAVLFEAASADGNTKLNSANNSRIAVRGWKCYLRRKSDKVWVQLGSTYNQNIWFPAGYGNAISVPGTVDVRIGSDGSDEVLFPAGVSYVVHGVWGGGRFDMNSWYSGSTELYDGVYVELDAKLVRNNGSFGETGTPRYLLQMGMDYYPSADSLATGPDPNGQGIDNRPGVFISRSRLLTDNWQTFSAINVLEARQDSKVPNRASLSSAELRAYPPPTVAAPPPTNNSGTFPTVGRWFDILTSTFNTWGDRDGTTANGNAPAIVSNGGGATANVSVLEGQTTVTTVQATGSVTVNSPNSWPAVPGPTPRNPANRYYFSTTGNQGNAGTRLSPWRSINGKQGVIPPNSELIILGASFTDTNMFSSFGGGTALPTGITIYPEQTGCVVTTTDGNAFVFDTAQSDWEVYGFNFTNCADVFGNGVITVSNNQNNWRIVNNTFTNCGSGNTNQDHSIYVSGGNSYSTCPRNGKILFNSVNNTLQTQGGAGLVHSYGSNYMMHDVEIAYNTVRGQQWIWGCIFTAGYKTGEAANVWVHDNDFRITLNTANTGGIIDFWNVNTAGFQGPDSSFVVERNIFEVTGGLAPCIRRRNGSAVIRNNTLYHYTNNQTAYAIVDINGTALALDPSNTWAQPTTQTTTTVNTVTYAISGGTDASRFTINPTTGLLQFGFSPSYSAPVDSNGDNIYQVVVRAQDTSGQFDTQTITVTVLQAAQPTGYQIRLKIHRSAAGTQNAIAVVWQSPTSSTALVGTKLFEATGVTFPTTLNSSNQAEAIILVPSTVTVSAGQSVKCYVEGGGKSTPIFTATVEPVPV